MKRTIEVSEYNDERVWFKMIVQSNDGRYAAVFYTLTTQAEIDADDFSNTVYEDYSANVGFHYFCDEYPDTEDCPYVVGGKCRWSDRYWNDTKTFFQELRNMGVDVVWYHLEKFLEREIGLLQ